jgi:hypothetical protein
MRADTAGGEIERGEHGGQTGVIPL